MLAIIQTPLKLPKVSVELSPKSVLEAFFTSKSALTTRVYRMDLNDFKTFLQVESLEEAVSLLLKNEGGPANALALSFRTHLMERKLASATINRRMAALRSLWKLALLVGLVKKASSTLLGLSSTLTLGSFGGVLIMASMGRD